MGVACSYSSAPVRVYFGCNNSLYILRNAEVLSHQTLRNLLGFSYIKNMSEDQLFKITRLQFDNWLFRPEKFPRLSRNRLQSRVGLIAQLVEHCSGVTEFRVQIPLRAKNFGCSFATA